MAVRPQAEKLCAIGEIMNNEDAAICLNNNVIDFFNAENTKQVMETVDSHEFGSFSTIHPIELFTSLMNPNKYLEYFAQSNTFHRAMDYFVLNNVMPVQYLAINKQYQFTVSALNEELKFLKYIGSLPWL